MPGKEDLRAIASFVYSKAHDSKDIVSDTHSIGAVLMTRAAAIGDLGQAIQSLQPDQKKFQDAFTNGLKGKNEQTFKKIIQHSAKLLRTPVTQDASTHFFKKSESPSTKEAIQTGLVKTHATKEHNFYKQSAPAQSVKGKSRVQKLS